MKKMSLLSLATMLSLCSYATPPSGNLSEDMIQKFKKAYQSDTNTKAIRNALATNGIDKLAINADASINIDKDFSHRVKSKGITDQKSSGRCWLFTGLNVLRAQMMSKHNLPELKLSQNYNFFYDQLEKSNLFLQGIIDNGSKPMDDKMVDWLFSSPISDGGTFSGVASNIMKYGVVPAEVMPETYSSNNTKNMSKIIATKLREDGLELRSMVSKKAKQTEIMRRKEQMLSEIYRILALNLGTPPEKFTWTRKDSKGNTIDKKEYTPQSFYKEFAGNNLKDNYVMVMNDPSREYHKLYEIDYDRHAYDGQNWTYINLPVDEIKKMAIASIKDNTMMYFSCDVGKYIDKENGTLNIENYDYESLLGVKFGMNKADRIRTHASASSHAMTLVAVDLDKNETPKKWLVENSWGKTANDGHLIITDKWFDEYMFRLVVDEKYVSPEIKKILKQKPIVLPAWDPMFAVEE